MAASSRQLTFLGHSTVRIELGGLRILTDPILVDRLMLLRRVAATVSAEAYAGTDLAVISHLHLDHFDLGSLRLLGDGVRILVPRGGGQLLSDAGFRFVDEMVAGDTVQVGNVRVSATPAVHSGYRPPFGPRAGALGYRFDGEHGSVYFAGDTDLFPEMREVGRDLDVALLPVWGWGPRLGSGHLNPGRAADALRMLRPRVTVPIHWGTLWPMGLGRVRPGRLRHPPLEFAALAAGTHPEGTVLVTTPGDSVDLTPVRLPRSDLR